MLDGESVTTVRNFGVHLLVPSENEHSDTGNVALHGYDGMRLKPGANLEKLRPENVKSRMQHELVDGRRATR
ncbi:hypothetical protein NECAME_15204 [Necator americanus]|uniref:Uncharacterized protein n=1 Tax=Necator americanus TaxID=51031 RepID=W2SLM6_NECAM|nr:hypothetical protein NECAME_15204 [Necator americanus]ETN69637.1 hypothetical protein NECAME_15204 [Necator americanus]